MGKTAKDTPGWVKAARQGTGPVYHAPRCEAWLAEQGLPAAGGHACTLGRANGPRGRRCWQDHDRSGGGSNPPRWYRKTVWTAPDRRRAKEAGARAAGECQATGYTEIQPDTTGHRHGAAYRWN